MNLKARTLCRMPLVAITVIALSLAYSEAAIANIYVSTTGSDSNAGTQASPYGTIKKGLANLSAGNTLYLCASACDGSGSGTFNENISSQLQTVPSGTDWTPRSGAVVIQA